MHEYAKYDLAVARANRAYKEVLTREGSTFTQHLAALAVRDEAIATAWAIHKYDLNIARCKAEGQFDV